MSVCTSDGLLLVLLIHLFCFGESKVIQTEGFFSNLFYCRNASFSNGQRGCFAGTFGSIMHRISSKGMCQERCRFLPALAASSGWKCGYCEDVPKASPESSPVSPMDVPVRTPIKPPGSAPIRSPVLSAPIPIKSPLPAPLPVAAPAALPTPIVALVPVKAPVPIVVPAPNQAPVPLPRSLPVSVPVSLLVPIAPIAPVPVPINTPMSNPEGAPVPSPLVASPTAPSGNSTVFKCGGAVNTGGVSANATCTSDLWTPTQNRKMHCYAYGGVTDPCALHNNNDANDGLYKSPSNCDRDTFYLWDEVCSFECWIVSTLSFEIALTAIIV
jgi:hypothetical protein